MRKMGYDLSTMTGAMSMNSETQNSEVQKKKISNIKNRGISVVVPFLNEEEGIELFCSTLDQYAASLKFPLELVFVDDGSTDRSVELLEHYHFNHIRSAQLVSFSKNFGSHAAIRAGVMHAKYDICTWLGSDLQEPLELLEKSYALIVENGYDVVNIEKKSIQVSKLNRGFSRFYSHMMQKYAVKSYSSGGISTIVFNGKVKELLNSHVESNSSIMLQIMDAGFKCKTLSMDFHERSAGVSKWTLSKKVKLFIDSFVAFSFMPIRLVSITGMVIFVLGLVIGIIAVINKIINPSVPMGYSTLVSIVALGFGVTNISLGIIAEYLWRTYDAARNRPVFIISETRVLKANADHKDHGAGGSDWR